MKLLRFSCLSFGIVESSFLYTDHTTDSSEWDNSYAIWPIGSCLLLSSESLVIVLPFKECAFFLLISPNPQTAASFPLLKYPVVSLEPCECVLSGFIVSDSLRPHGLWSARLLCPWDFPGKNTGVGCHFLLQGIFLTWGLNPRLLLWQVDSLPLSHLGSP